MAAVRSFVAIDLAPEAVTALGRLCGALRGPCAAAGLEVGWVRSENLHVTLKFLGDVEEAALSALGEALAGALAGVAAPRLQVQGVGAFPTVARPRVLVSHLHGDAAGLAGLASLCEDVAAAAGHPREERPFRPHVTIGRVRGARRGAALEPIFAPHAQESFGAPFTVGSVVLYESRPAPHGVRYVPRAQVPLSDPSAS
jgi:RNA 2',3'-cyclic 3'-phosphodiesterase